MNLDLILDLENVESSNLNDLFSMSEDYKNQLELESLRVELSE